MDWGEAVAAAIALGALVVAGLARRDSKHSAASSRESARAARDSADLAQAERERAIERGDVAWEPVRSRQDPARLRLRNLGADVAHAVVVVWLINGERFTSESTAVDGGESIEFDAREQRARAEAAGGSPVGSGVIVARTVKWHVSARVTWRTRLGTPDVAEIDWRKQ